MDRSSEESQARPEGIDERVREHIDSARAAAEGAEEPLRSKLLGILAAFEDRMENRARESQPEPEASPKRPRMGR